MLLQGQVQVQVEMPQAQGQKGHMKKSLACIERKAKTKELQKDKVRAEVGYRRIYGEDWGGGKPYQPGVRGEKR